MANRIVFLPGAGGGADFWRPVASLLPPVDSVFLSWPGLGDEPASPGINSVDDLVTHSLAALSAPSDLVAQSMGGVVAIRAALRAPHLVRRLVLVATSGGVPVLDLGGADWRAAYYAAYPDAAAWIAAPQPDLSDRLRHVTAPTLLPWGDADPISPVAVGELLRQKLPDAKLRVVAQGGHDLARTHAARVAALIAAHLRLGERES